MAQAREVVDQKPAPPIRKLLIGVATSVKAAKDSIGAVSLATGPMLRPHCCTRIAAATC